MKQIQAHHQIILDSIADGVFTVDMEMSITSFNRAAEEITGFSRENAVGLPCFDVLRANVCEKNCLLRKTIDTEQPVRNFPVYILRADKKLIPISVTTALLKDAGGRVVGGVETFRDLTAVDMLRKVIRKQHSFEDIISKNAKMLDLFAILPQVAESNCSVLIEGDSGTGKELVARAIHNNSPVKSDIVVYATPLYHYTVNAEMKRFIERTLPVLEPFFEQKDNRTVHPLRQTPPDAVILSVAGFVEMSVFDLLSSYINLLCRNDRLLAEIYRPAAETLSRIEGIQGDVFEATNLAGRELVESRRVSNETLNRIQQPLIDFDTFAQIGNLYWKTCIAEGVTPKEFGEKDMVPRFDSIENFMILFPFGLNSEVVGARKVLLQFNFSDDVTGSCWFNIQKGNISAEEGSKENPDITIETPFELWMDIMTGKADGHQMFMDQKYQIDGDLSLMIQLFQK